MCGRWRWEGGWADGWMDGGDRRGCEGELGSSSNNMGARLLASAKRIPSAVSTRYSGQVKTKIPKGGLQLSGPAEQS
ncbi:hypothetical protein EMPG_15938 [Blastomyces silverae]|uniref:Uncharacterized protein n=1 Tax=Blastomyces silverae TaxID=2060906 RepID=A0A0H1BC85_9EURO|nr:hypothetical protein EMPG_15938 [Blastomyces silverae]